MHSVQNSDSYAIVVIIIGILWKNTVLLLFTSTISLFVIVAFRNLSGFFCHYGADKFIKVTTRTPH
jgi:hypothetical protein